MNPVLLAAIAGLALIALPVAGAAGETAAGERCGTPRAGFAYTRRVERVLAAGRDVWGERLTARRDGPSYAAASRLLPPLLYAAGRRGRRLTASGVYYLPFTVPLS